MRLPGMFCRYVGVSNENLSDRSVLALHQSVVLAAAKTGTQPKFKFADLLPGTQAGTVGIIYYLQTARSSMSLFPGRQRRKPVCRPVDHGGLSATSPAKRPTCPMAGSLVSLAGIRRSPGRLLRGVRLVPLNPVR